MRKNRNAISLGAALIAVLLIPCLMCSCAGTKKKKFNVANQWSQVHLVDPDIAPFITITNVRARILESGNLQVSLKIANLTDNDLALRVKFKFLDEGKFSIEETSWMPYLITRGMIEDIIQNSISHEARNFQVFFDWQE